MNRRNRGIIMISALLAAALLLAGCGSSAQPATSAPAAQTKGAGSQTVQEQTEAASTPAAETQEQAETAALTEAQGETWSEPGGEAASEEPGNEAASSLVIYFSRMGNTDFPSDVDAVSSASLVTDEGVVKGNAELLAEWIAEAAGTETYEILTADKYPESYNDTIDLAKQEQNQGKRPELANHLEHPEALKEIWLVLPNWWGNLPMPLYTFLEEYDFSGAVIHLLVTHGGSGFSGMQDTIRGLQPNAALGKTLKIYHSDTAEAEDQVKAWVRE